MALAAFSAECEYSHVLPFRRSGYVDGLFHLSMLGGAAKRAGDGELLRASVAWLNRLLSCGPDARSWYVAPHDGYEPEGAYWVKRSPQSFAGPAALQWAGLPGLVPEEEQRDKARLLCAVAWPFGWLCRSVRGLRQHVSSVMLAHLLLERRPPASMRFLAVRNPLYSWQFGISCEEDDYPNTGPWPAKDWPGSPVEEQAEVYTPTCAIVARYLRGT